MVRSIDDWIHRHHKRLAFGHSLRVVAPWLAVFLLSFGSAVLLVKLQFPALWPGVLWGFVGVVPVWMTASGFGMRNQLSRRQSTAMLDSRIEAGGLLMTVAETRHSEWATALPRNHELWRRSMPKLDGFAFLRRLLIPVVFTIAVCFVPLRAELTAKVPPRSAAARVAQDLHRTLKALQRSPIVEQAEQEELEREINKLIEDSKTEKLTHERWESVDNLRERMRLRIAEAAGLAEKARRASVELKLAAGADAPAMSVERADELQQDIEEFLKRMAKSGKLNSDAVPVEIQESVRQVMKQGKLKLPPDAKEQRVHLGKLQAFLDQEAKRLNQSREQLDKSPIEGQQKLAELTIQQMIELAEEKSGIKKGVIEKLMQQANLDEAALQRAMDRGFDAQAIRDLMDQAGVNPQMLEMARRTGLDRVAMELAFKQLGMDGDELDRITELGLDQQALDAMQRAMNAAAELDLVNPDRGAKREPAFGDEKKLASSKFKESVLPPGFFEDPKQQQTGTTKVAPTVVAGKISPRNPVVDYAPGSKKAWRRQIRPRHQQVAKEYFKQQPSDELKKGN